MINIFIYFLIFFIGILFGNMFNMFGNVLSNKHNKNYIYTNCKNCNYKLKFTDISLISYIFNLGRCKNCKKKISFFPSFIEIMTGLLFLICYIKYNNSEEQILYLIYSLSFISSLIMIIVSDIKYMIIPDQIIIVFTIIMSIIKLLIGYSNEEIKSILDLGYEILFLFYDGFFMFLIMYGLKSLGDFLCKRDSMGGGDVKLMFYISLVLGWRISILILFLAAFIALPVSIVKMIRKKEVMLPFGPYIAISTLIIFLFKIDFNTVLDYIL